jgi:DNA-binding SARP family transcriptional activator
MSIAIGTPATKLFISINDSPVETHWPVQICLFGSFRLLKAGQPVLLRNAIKTKAFLICLALEKTYGVSREALLQKLWPDEDVVLAGQSLNSLVHSLRKLLSNILEGESPILHADDRYWLNTDAGIGVDVDWFEALALHGEQQEHSGNMQAAVHSYCAAVDLYRGDLCFSADTQTMVIGESLRAMNMSLLSRLADYYYTLNDLQTCLIHAQRLLSLDPCREDAHRVVMRCYYRKGERTQALRQYRLCETVLRSEFDATPDAATTALYEQIRCASIRD